MKNISRRNFLQIIAVSGAAGLTFKFGLDALRADEMVSETRLLMGTVINIKLIGPDAQAASAAVKASFEHMTALEGVLSRFLPESQLSKLNREGALQDAHPALVELIGRSHELSRMSEGAFDITVKPLLDLYQATPGVLPSDEQISQTLPLVDYRKLFVDAGTLCFGQAGMSITLDGIAKGRVVDGGVSMLKSMGFENVLVEAGGDMMASSSSADGKSWTIGVNNPRPDNSTEFIATFSVNNKAVTTSGDYLNTFTADYSRNHIIDPWTGESPAELSSATVIASNTAEADAISTTLMVLGVQRGLEFVKQFPDVEALLVTKDLAIYKTSGFPIN